MPEIFNPTIGGVDLACGHNVTADELPRCLAGAAAASSEGQSGRAGAGALRRRRQAPTT
jgi:hypothetical protein